MLKKTEGNISKLGKTSCRAIKEIKEDYKPTHEEIRRLKLTTPYVRKGESSDSEICFEKTIYKVYASQIEYRHKKGVMFLNYYPKKNEGEKREFTGISDIALKNFFTACCIQVFKFNPNHDEDLYRHIEDDVALRLLLEAFNYTQIQFSSVFEQNGITAFFTNEESRNLLLREALKIHNGDVMIATLTKRIEDLLGGEPDMGVFVCPATLNPIFHLINPAVFATLNLNYILLERKKKDGRNNDKSNFKFESLPKITIVSFEGLDPVQNMNRKLISISSPNTQYISILYHEDSVHDEQKIKKNSLRYVSINLYNKDDEELDKILINEQILSEFDRNEFKTYKEACEWNNKEIIFLFERIIFKLIQKFEPDVILFSHNFSLNKSINPNVKINLTASGLGKILHELSLFVSNRLIVIAKSIPEEINLLKEISQVEFFKFLFTLPILKKINALNKITEAQVNDLLNQESRNYNIIIAEALSKLLNQFSVKNSQSVQSQTYIAEMIGAAFSAILGQTDYNSLKEKHYKNALDQPNLFCALQTLLNINILSEALMNKEIFLNSTLSPIKMSGVYEREYVFIERTKNALLDKFSSEFSEKLNLGSSWLLNQKKAQIIYKNTKSSLLDSVFIGSTRFKLQFLNDDGEKVNFFFRKNTDYFVKMVDEVSQIYYIIFLDVDIKGVLWNFFGLVSGKRLSESSIDFLLLKKFNVNFQIQGTGPSKLVESAMCLEIQKSKKKKGNSSFGMQADLFPQINLYQFSGQIISQGSKTRPNSDLFELQISLKQIRIDSYESVEDFDVVVQWNRIELNFEGLQAEQFFRNGAALLPLNNFFVILGGICLEPSSRSYITNSIDYIYRKNFTIKRISKGVKQNKVNYTDQFTNPLMNPCVIPITEKKSKKKIKKFWLVGGEHSVYLLKSYDHEDRPQKTPPDNQPIPIGINSGISTTESDMGKKDDMRITTVTRYVVEFQENGDKVDITSFKSDPLNLQTNLNKNTDSSSEIDSYTVCDSFFAKADRYLMEEIENKEKDKDPRHKYNFSIMKWAKGVRQMFDEKVSIQYVDEVKAPFRKTLTSKLLEYPKITDKKDKFKSHYLHRRTLFYRFSLEKTETAMDFKIDINGLEVLDCFEQAESIFRIPQEHISVISRNQYAYSHNLKLGNVIRLSSINLRKNHLCINKNYLYALVYKSIGEEGQYSFSIHSFQIDELEKIDIDMNESFISEFQPSLNKESSPKKETQKGRDDREQRIGIFQKFISEKLFNGVSLLVNDNFIYIAGNVSEDKFLIMRAANKHNKSKINLLDSNDCPMRILDLGKIPLDFRNLHKPLMISIQKYIMLLPSRIENNLSFGFLFNKKEGFTKFSLVVLKIDSQFSDFNFTEYKFKFLTAFVSEQNDKSNSGIINLIAQIKKKKTARHEVDNPSVLSLHQFPFSSDNVDKMKMEIEIEGDPDLLLIQTIIKNHKEELIEPDNPFNYIFTIEAFGDCFRTNYSLCECLSRNERKNNLENIKFYVRELEAFLTLSEIKAKGHKLLGFKMSNEFFMN